MRKMMLFTAWAELKLGCCRLHEPASGRPVTVKSAYTPPFGALRFTVPFRLK